MQILVHRPRLSALLPRSDCPFVWLEATDASVESAHPAGVRVTLCLDSASTAEAVRDALTGHGALHKLLLREIDPRLLSADPSPTGGLIYRRCHVCRLPLSAPTDGWEWQHEDAEPGDPRHGVGTLADCLDEIDEAQAQARVMEAAE